MLDVGAYPLALKLLLVVLAAYRLASLIAGEEGPYLPLGILQDQTGYQTGVFERVRQLAGCYGEQRTALSRGLACPLCVGVWATLVMLLLVHIPWLDFLVLWLGLAGGQKFLYRLHGGD